MPTNPAFPNVPFNNPPAVPYESPYPHGTPSQLPHTPGYIQTGDTPYNPPKPLTNTPKTNG